MSEGEAKGKAKGKAEELKGRAKGTAAEAEGKAEEVGSSAPASGRAHVAGRMRAAALVAAHCGQALTLQDTPWAPAEAGDLCI